MPVDRKSKVITIPNISKFNCNWLYHLTGGRPTHLTTFAFMDIVKKKEVYHCIDKFGRHWYATGSWSIFRMEGRK
jgi:hypothetical protein